VESGESRVNPARASVMMTSPPTVMPRGPNLSNTMPDSGLMMMPTAAAGIMTRPVAAAEAPKTFCRKMGRVTLVTAAAQLMSVTMMAEHAKSRDLSAWICNRGSSRLRWRLTKSTRQATPATIPMMTMGLVQPKVDALEKP